MATRGLTFLAPRDLDWLTIALVSWLPGGIGWLLGTMVGPNGRWSAPSGATALPHILGAWRKPRQDHILLLKTSDSGRGP